MNGWRLGNIIYTYNILYTYIYIVYIYRIYIYSVQSLSHVQLFVTHGPQQARLPCPSPAPTACSNSCPLSWWCHPTISSSALPFSSCLQSFPESGSFEMSHFFASGSQNWSFSFRISPSNEYSGLFSFRIDWFDLLRADCLDLFAVQGTLKSLLQHHSSKASILRCLAFFMVQLSHLYMTTGKTIALTRWTFVGKVMSLLCNMLSRLVIAFLPRNKHLLNNGCSHHLQWLLAKKDKISHFSIVSPSIRHEGMGPEIMILVFWMLSFKPTFSLSSFTFIKRLFSPSLSAIRVVSSAYRSLVTFLLQIFIPASTLSSLAFCMM